MRKRTRVVLWLLLAGGLGAMCASAGAADPPYYARKAAWPETLVAAREGLMKAEAEAAAQAEAATRAQAASQAQPAAGAAAEAQPGSVPAQAGAAQAQAAGAAKGLALGPWHQIGPFHAGPSAGFAYEYPPEKEIDLAKAYGNLRWAAHPEYADGVVEELQAPGQAATYLYRTITAAKAKSVPAWFGSDDGLVVWLNGKKLIAKDVPRTASANQDTAALDLQKGENRLLLKIHNLQGQHGFYFSLDGKAGVAAARKADRKTNPRALAREGLWDLLARDFADEASREEMARERADGLWNADWTPGGVADLARRYARGVRVPDLAAKAKVLVAQVKDVADLRPLRQVYHQSREAEEAAARATNFNFEALRLAVTDLMETFGGRYPKGREYLDRLEALRAEGAALGAAGAAASEKAADLGRRLAALHADALLANPLLDFERLLLVRRRADRLGLPQNWQGNSTLSQKGYENEIATLAVKDPRAPLKTLYRPEGGEFVGDLDLHWNADRLLFSMPGPNGRWQVFEIRADGTGLRQVTPSDHPDVDQYDGCYLPDGRVLFCSTACYLGVPCVGGSDHVGSLYLLGMDGKTIRQLTFDQDHSWCPTVLNNGRVIYTRWEYSDTPHYFSRILFEMNPDGTAQFEHYGSNSYWPNSIFYARPVPNHPTKVIAVISGHHGTARAGELILFDPALGRHEASGVVQRIPGYGQPVEPIIRDGLVDPTWPKFLHPWPLSDKYFLVSCKPDAKAPWGLYLVDVFDNRLLLREEPGCALLEPVPLRKAPTPPVIPDRVNPERKDATVYLVDVYQGKGLEGVPRGSVKSLRVFTNHFGYRGMGGHIHIGIDGPWDAKRILGTVPVNADGSALFRAPANVPLVVQPLDAEGKALQVMRSWYTAMPGEFASCVGCHEPQSNGPPPARLTAATAGRPSEIEPWYGPARPFSFPREVQGVLDKYCVSCHNGQPRQGGRVLPDFRGKTARPDYKGRFDPAYEALHPYVRRPGPESDYHLPVACEYAANTSELVQMLKKGHHGVALDREAWDRLYTWIDLNVPCHGTWSEHRAIAGAGHQRRLELAKLYANLDVDPEAYPAMEVKAVTPVAPAPSRAAAAPAVACAGWPFDAAEAARRQAVGGPPSRSIDLGDGVTLDLVRVPAGEFIMGDPAGLPDERPAARVVIAKPFWMAKYEVANAQYRRFDPLHDSGYISVTNKDQSNRGERVDGDKQPALRVNWHQASAFCRWLSRKTGQAFSLPTEAQWEYACRAGTATPLSFGAVDADFSKFANLADERVANLTRRDSPRWIPRVDQVNDGDVVTGDFDRRQPNAWGLHDLHGNVAEWTRSAYRAYPYRADDGRESDAAEGERVVRGGSFYDRPQRARSAFRLAYPPWQAVYNVGFRVVAEDDAKAVATAVAE